MNLGHKKLPTFFYSSNNTMTTPQVMLTDDQSLDDGEKIANDLQEKLGVKQEDLLTGAYMDMILKQ